MLKVQLHIHSAEDPRDDIPCTAKELIDEAVAEGFDVLAFTCHDKVIHTPELEQYAKKHHILLIPGVERTIEGKEVLLYNLTEAESRQITSFSKLMEFKQKRLQQDHPFLIIAPHPFYFGPVCLRKKVVKYLDIFDAWEHSFFYCRWINPNKKMLHLAEKHHKPVIGTADVHLPRTLSRTYSLLNAEKNIPAIFQAIKNNRVKIQTAPLSFPAFTKVFLNVVLSITKRALGKNQPKSL